MLKTILHKAMQEQNLSSHTAAQAIGVSHTTILRALRGDAVDVDTIIKIAKFLHTRPSELLNSMGGGVSLAEDLSVLLSYSRDLEAELSDAVERVKAGTLDVSVLRDVVSYALYKFKSGEHSNVSRKPTKP